MQICDVPVAVVCLVKLRNSELRELELYRIEYLAIQKQMSSHCYLFASPLMKNMSSLHQNKNGSILVSSPPPPPCGPQF